jgi:hypothetical protein
MNGLNKMNEMNEMNELNKMNENEAYYVPHLEMQPCRRTFWEICCAWTCTPTSCGRSH